jgi:phosphoadenosine phosphosulfate reductase
MPLVDHTLFGVVDKVQIAIDRLRQYEPPEGYYLAFSGGKDSTVLYELAKMSKVKFDAHMNLTSVDPPELIRHVKQYYPEVQIHRPVTTMWKLIPKKLMPPTRIARYCCGVLKEQGGRGRALLTGVRWEESTKRKKRKMFEFDRENKTRFIVHPIIDWTTLDIWDFIKERGLPYCSLYDEGFKRLGCIGCPMAGTKGMQKEFERWPKYRDAYLRALGRMIEVRRAKGKDLDPNSGWNTPEEVMDWWIYAQGKGGKGDLCEGFADQTVLFE